MMTVPKLMRALALVCRDRWKRRYACYQGEQGTVGPNMPNWEFDADTPTPCVAGLTATLALGRLLAEADVIRRLLGEG